MRRSRRAVSLVELLAVMSVVTTVFVLLSMWLVMLVRGSDAGQKHLQWVIIQDRLASQFRRDVHEAVAIAEGNSPKLLRLQCENDRCIIYRMEERQVLREELTAGEATRQEIYRLSQPVAVTIETEQTEQATWLRMAVAARDVHGNGTLAGRLRIDARLGAIAKYGASEAQENSP
jgi:hypothetical protein